MMTSALVGSAPAAAAEPVDSETIVAAELPVAAPGPLFVLPLPVTEEELTELPVAPSEGESEEGSPALPRPEWAMAMPVLLAVSVPPSPPLVRPAVAAAAAAMVPVAPSAVAADAAPPVLRAEAPALPPSDAGAEAVVIPGLNRAATSAESPATVAPPEPPGRGTVSAKDVEPMQPAEKTERIAEAAEQNLPRGKIVPLTETVRAAERVEARPVVPLAMERRPLLVERTAVVAAAVATESAVRTDPASAVVEVRPPAAVEKVFTEISQQVVSFKRVGALTAEVQVRPDRQTEITLHLNLRAGQVEVTARLERGDYDGLRAHWAGLQESLAQQGVRLGPLQPTAAALEERFGGGGQSAPHFHDRTFREFEWERGEAAADGGARLNPAKPQRAVAVSGRGWERWA